ncbi:MAG: hypothetical protein FJY95_22945 [Candidatus Handelsmanbacteria bacterium]|nr:hypothetical protein [Candidatus Handelsmanbacteria bacterium]
MQLLLTGVDSELDEGLAFAVVDEHGPPLVVGTKATPLRETGQVVPAHPGLDRGGLEMVEDVAGQLHMRPLAVQFQHLVLGQGLDGQGEKERRAGEPTGFHGRLIYSGASAKDKKPWQVCPPGLFSFLP